MSEEEVNQMWGELRRATHTKPSNVSGELFATMIADAYERGRAEWKKELEEIAAADPEVVGGLL